MIEFVVHAMRAEHDPGFVRYDAGRRPVVLQPLCQTFGRRILAQELWNAARFRPLAFMLVKLRLKRFRGLPFAGGLANTVLDPGLFRLPGC